MKARTKKFGTRAVAMLLALATMFSLLVSPASAAVPPDNSGSIADGSSSVTAITILRSTGCRLPVERMSWMSMRL